MLAKTSVFERAVLFIEDNGWCQRFYKDDLGRVCLMQAIGEVALDGEWSLACKAILNIVGEPEAWNDQPGRTKEEVVNLLRSLS